MPKDFTPKKKKAKKKKQRSSRAANQRRMQLIRTLLEGVIGEAPEQDAIELCELITLFGVSEQARLQGADPEAFGQAILLSPIDPRMRLFHAIECRVEQTNEDPKRLIDFLIAQLGPDAVRFLMN